MQYASPATWTTHFLIHWRQILDENLISLDASRLLLKTYAYELSNLLDIEFNEQVLTIHQVV